MNPDFSGVWKANLEMSRLLGPAPRAVLVKIGHSEPQLEVETEVTRMDGTVGRFTFRGRTTGDEVINELQGVPMRSRLRWIGKELEIESWVNLGGREAHFRDYWSFRDRTLVMEHRDDDLTGQITLLERVN
jgi:hypothetical protein